MGTGGRFITDFYPLRLDSTWESRFKRSFKSVQIFRLENKPMIHRNVAFKWNFIANKYEYNAEGRTKPEEDSDLRWLLEVEIVSEWNALISAEEHIQM